MDYLSYNILYLIRYSSLINDINIDIFYIFDALFHSSFIIPINNSH